MTAENTNFKVSMMASTNMSEYQKALRKSTNLRPIYFDQVVNYINNKIEDSDLRSKILDVAKKYPHSALSRFVSNFELIRSTCLKELNAEKNKETKARIRQEAKVLSADDLLNIQADLETDFKNSEIDIENNDKIPEDIIDHDPNQEVNDGKISGN